MSVDRTDGLRYRFLEGDWAEHFSRLKSMRFRGAIVGPRGSGKTTLLGEVAERLAFGGLDVVRCRPDHYGVDESTPQALAASLIGEMRRGRILLVDSAERLPKLAWWRLVAMSARSGGLIAAVHRGSLLPTWVRCRTSWRLACELLRQLDVPADRRLLRIARKSYDARRGNIREVFRELYDAIARGEVS